MKFTDKNGKEIKFRDHLDVPLDIFCNGVVVKNENEELALELKYDSKEVALKDLNEAFFHYVEILD